MDRDNLRGPQAPPPSAQSLPGAPAPSPAAVEPVDAAAQSRAERLLPNTLLAAAGGYLDGFTYVGHGHVFANAMTGNVVLLGIEALSFDARGHWHGSLRHLTPILMFLLGVWAARALHLPRLRRLVHSPYAAVLITELAILLVLACLPSRTPDFLFTASIAFAASMQVQTFRSVAGHTYNSTFTTGNLRSLSVALFDWCVGGVAPEPSSSRGTAEVFAIICSAFLLGATAGGFSVLWIGNRALATEILLLGIVLARVYPSRSRM